MVKLSDDLSDVTAREAVVYLVAGESISTFPDDCLTRFVGRVNPGLECTDDEIKFTIIDKSKFFNVMLPQTYLDDTTYPDVPLEYKNNKIPLVYGEFNITGGDEELFDYSGTGLCRAVPINSENGQEFIVADHEGEEITSLWEAYSGLSHPALHGSPTLNATDSGYITAILHVSATSGLAWMSVYAHPELSVELDGDDTPVEFEYGNGIDTDDTTYTEGHDTVDTGTGGSTSHRSYWKLKDSSWLSSHFTSGAVVYYQAKLNSQVGTPDDCEMYFCSEVGTINTGQGLLYTGALTSTGSWDTSEAVAWDSGDDYYSVWRPNYLALYVNKDAWASADSVEFNQTVVYIYGLMAKIGIPCDKNSRGTFAACRGRMYGTWINSRSSSYSDDFTIEDPSGIIESLLRDEIGLETADIDITSFTAAEDTNVEARINLHSGNEMLLFDVIRQLAEQSTFAFFWSAAGKPYLIPMAEWNRPFTIEEVVPVSMIASRNGMPDVKFEKTKFVANKLNIRSRYQQEYEDKYRDYTEHENTTSTGGKFGTIAADLKWPNICGDSKDYVANHYLTYTDSPGYDPQQWAVEHIEVTFRTVGFAYAHLQPGAWIQLSDDLDNYITAFGESWGDIDLLVTNIKIGTDSTEIRAIELY